MEYCQRKSTFGNDQKLHTQVFLSLETCIPWNLLLGALTLSKMNVYQQIPPLYLL